MSGSLRMLLVVAVFAPCAGATAADRPLTKTPVPALSDRCAKAEPPAGTPDIPGGDIFGILSPTDIGDPCSFGFASETTGRASKRDGRYIAATTKSQFAYTYSEQLSFAASPFVSAFSWSDVTVNHGILLTTGDGVERSRFRGIDFDGVSVEASWRVLQRSVNQPLAITVSTEPRWFRRGPITGYRGDGKQIELKLFADLALSERWFAAANLVYGFGTERLDILNAEPIKASAVGVLSALTWQAYKGETGLVQGVFVGAEARYIAGFAGLACNIKASDALFAGPTLAIGFQNGSMLNVVWSPQVWGRAQPASAPGPLDLDAFERRQFRIKFATPL